MVGCGDCRIYGAYRLTISNLSLKPDLLSGSNRATSCGSRRAHTRSCRERLGGSGLVGGLGSMGAGGRARMKGMAMTVLGSVPIDRLDITLMHEHVLFD